MIRGLSWGMTRTQACDQFEGPQLLPAVGGSDLSASPVPLGPFASSVLLGFGAAGLCSIRFKLDITSLGSYALCDTLDLFAQSLSGKYGEPTFEVRGAWIESDMLTAACIDRIRSGLKEQQNGAIRWRWHAASALLTFEYTALWQLSGSSECVMLHYERPSDMGQGRSALTVQLECSLL